MCALKRVPGIIKDDEEDLEENRDALESGLSNLSALSRRAEANKKEAGPVAERRFEREWATTAFYEDVICDMKVRGDKINPYYMPPVARESRNMVMIDKLIRRMSGQKYVLADVDMPSELSRSLIFDTVPETISRNPKEAADQFWKRLERTMQEELNNFRMNCMAGDRLPENKGVAAQIAMARDTKEKRLVRELEVVKRLNARFASQTLAEVVYEDDEDEKKKDGKKEDEKPGKEAKKVETKAKLEPKKPEKTVSAAPTVAATASKAASDAKKKAVNAPEQKKKK